jgi:hypothetical protein
VPGGDDAIGGLEPPYPSIGSVPGGYDASDLKSCRNGTVQAYAYVYATRDACTRKKTTTESLGAGCVNAKSCHTHTPLALLAIALAWRLLLLLLLGSASC